MHFHFRGISNGTVSFVASNVTVTGTSKKEKIAQVQIHNSYEGRLEVLRETTLASFKKYPTQVSAIRDKMVDDYAKSTADFRKEATMYGVHSRPGIKWGMNVAVSAFGEAASALAILSCLAFPLSNILAVTTSE